MNLQIGADLLDRGWVPDTVVRMGIRRLLRQRLESEWARSEADADRRLGSWVERLKEEAIASEPTKANEQHYEVPAGFFEVVLGPHLKYSSGLWPEHVGNLGEAEAAMLELTVERAQVRDGQKILDLGCGWGSLSLWMAERCPNSEILAVSNSHGQGDFIRRRAAERGLTNLRHQVGDVERLELEGGFDRIVSIEMFEHMRNYSALMERIAGWLTADGRLFVHIFCHRDLTYAFEDRGPSDWMARHFFRGGLMPAAGLLPRFDEHLRVEETWLVSGIHYQRTAEAWLANLDAARPAVMRLFAATYGEEDSAMWLERWRIFFMACSELFGSAGGDQWQLAHYRFQR